MFFFVMRLARKKRERERVCKQRKKVFFFRVEKFNLLSFSLCLLFSLLPPSLPLSLYRANTHSHVSSFSKENKQVQQIQVWALVG